MKTSVALLAVVAFVAVPAFPSSPAPFIPPLIPLPEIYRSSSQHSPETLCGSSADSCTNVTYSRPGGTVHTSTNDHSAEAATASSSDRSHQDIIKYHYGAIGTSSSSQETQATEDKFKSKDHRLLATDCKGNTVSEVDKTSSASTKVNRSSGSTNQYTYVGPRGDSSYGSIGSSVQNSASSSDEKFAGKDYTKTVTKVNGGSINLHHDQGAEASRKSVKCEAGDYIGQEVKIIDQGNGVFNKNEGSGGPYTSHGTNGNDDGSSNN